MPLAWATANGWEAYTSLPMDYDAVFYWWTPDPTFLRLGPVQVVLEVHVLAQRIVSVNELTTLRG